ncbi:Transposase_24 domain-containing protein, partial [Cephalotus follicularis]
MKQNNEPVNRPSMWRTTRKKKDGTFDDYDGAKEIEEQLTTKISTLSPENSQDPTMLDQVFVDVVGGDGHVRVRTMGIVVVPPSSKSRTSSFQASQSKARIRVEYEERFNDLQTNLEQQISDQQRQIAELITAMRTQNVTSSRFHSTIPTLASSVSESQDLTFLPNFDR